MIVIVTCCFYRDEKICAPSEFGTLQLDTKEGWLRTIGLRLIVCKPLLCCWPFSYFCTRIVLLIVHYKTKKNERIASDMNNVLEPLHFLLLLVAAQRTVGREIGSAAGRSGTGVESICVHRMG